MSAAQRAAPWPQAVLAQAKVELALTLRRGESVLLTLGIPVLLLVFFSAVDVLQLPDGTEDAIDFLTPGILALAVMSTAMVSLGIATGFERQYGVLKRLGTTPLGRRALLVAKTLAILVIELIQVAVLAAVAVALGWRPDGSPLPALAAALLATVGFAGLGLLLAGTLRGEVTLAAANGLYLVLLLLGGMVFPLDRLPGALRSFAELLPAAALSSALEGALSGSAAVPGKSWAVLLAWAIAAPALAGATFRWE